MVAIAASNTALQTLADNEMRGRVMSIFSMMIVGMAPFGSLLMGWAADQVGAPLVVAIGGGFCALGGLIFARQLPRAGSRVLVVRVDHQRSDPYAQDRRLARAEASFTAKGSLKGDSKPLVALRSFVIRQLWKKFFRHGYRKIRISTRPGKKPMRWLGDRFR